MTVTYNKLLENLKENYKMVPKKEKVYFLDDEGGLVASCNNNSISMFFDFEKKNREIWNHKGTVVATFIKDFRIGNTSVDAMLIQGLLGATNDTSVKNNVYEMTVNDEIDGLYNYDGIKYGAYGSIESYNHTATINVGKLTISNLKVSGYGDNYFANVLNFKGIKPKYKRAVVKDYDNTIVIKNVNIVDDPFEYIKLGLDEEPKTYKKIKD